MGAEVCLGSFSDFSPGENLQNGDRGSFLEPPLREEPESVPDSSGASTQKKARARLWSDFDIFRILNFRILKLLMFWG